MAKKPKKIRKTIEYQTFLNDSDGMTQRDYLLLISTSVFFLFIAVGLSILLTGRSLDEMYLRLVDIVTPVIMTIVASVFTIEGVEKVTNEMQLRREQKSNEVEEISEQTEEIIEEEL